MSEPNEIPPDKILYPESMTDDQIENFGWVIFPKFECDWLYLSDLLTPASKEAARHQDRESLQHLLRGAKTTEAWISHWADRLEQPDSPRRPSARHKELQEHYGQLCRSILDALNGELPGQESNGDGEDSKNA